MAVQHVASPTSTSDCVLAIVLVIYLACHKVNMSRGHLHYWSTRSGVQDLRTLSSLPRLQAYHGLDVLGLLDACFLRRRAIPGFDHLLTQRHELAYLVLHELV